MVIVIVSFVFVKKNLVYFVYVFPQNFKHFMKKGHEISLNNFVFKNKFVYLPYPLPLSWVATLNPNLATVLPSISR